MNPLIAVILLLILGLLVYARTARRPTSLGYRDGRLAPCPDTPNCVSTQSGDPAWGSEPLGVSGDPESAFHRLREAVRTLPGCRIAVEEPGYLHAECTIPIIGFVDDLEALLDSEAGVIHLRSASRRGYSDLGVNRKRLRELRRRYEATP
jgi:uncharacterized protein (DUF1499 family)